MQLREVLTKDAAFDPRFAAREVTGISANSRAVKPGDIFVALSGNRTDGTRFIADAVQAGAVAIVAERLPALPPDVIFVRVTNARRALSLMAARFFPRQPETIAAVTGTSGKTSIVAFLRQIWQTLGLNAASVGTVGVVTGSREEYGSLTTPDPVALHRTLDALASEGVTHLAVEASSHGLDQHRLDGLRIKVGAFTNISRDHLDYHPTIEAYFNAKLRLFSDLTTPGGTAVINADDPYASRVAAAAVAHRLQVLTVGRQGKDVTLAQNWRDGFAQRLRVTHRGKTFSLRLPLVGGFQVENALVAAGMALATGGAPDAVFAALEQLRGAKGRLDLVGTREGAPIFVDYAHKPDALAKALEALRPYAGNRLIVVFGAGGDRDKGKRPMMGAIAAEKADRVIVTDDNPRSEDPAQIRAEIMAAAPGAIEIGDRGAAIRAAVADLRPGDVLLVAGKGHESGQIVGDKTLPFTDHDAVAAALGENAA
ncbi:MAG: UDP-N-acetylmuramoyl-L-alanyl-D-glutamate--2,6-diaminopimelate ligase [Variibacter sp.]